MSANYALRRRLVMSSQEKVAGALAGEKVKVVFDGKGPCVDLDSMTIHMPHMADELTDDEMQLIRMYIDHEVGHVRYSDPKSVHGHSQVVFRIFNCIEDGRINRLMGDHRYGCKMNLEKGRLLVSKTHVAKRKEFDAMGKAGSFARAITGLYLTSEGQSIGASLKEIGASHDTGARDYLKSVKDIIDKFPDMKTSQDALGHAKAIYARWKSEIEKAKEEPEEEEDEEEKKAEGEAENSEGDADASEEEEEGEGAEGDEWEEGEGEEEGDEDHDSAGADDESEDSEEEDSEEDDWDTSDSEGDDEGEEGDDEGEASDSDEGKEGGEDEEEGGDPSSAESYGDSSDGEREEEEEEEGEEGEKGSPTDSDEDEDDEWDDLVISDEDYRGDAETTDDDDSEVVRKEAAEKMTAVLETQDYSKTKDTEADIEAALEALRKGAEEAESTSYGAVVGGDVELKIAKNPANTSSVTRSYRAYRDNDKVIELSRDFIASTDSLYTEARKATSYIKSRMQQDLMGRGKMWVRHQDTGTLDDKKLAGVSCGETRIFKRRLKRQKVNAAMMLLIDNSGSMNGEKLKLATKLGMAFSEACELNDVPNEVTGFTTAYSGPGSYSDMRTSGGRTKSTELRRTFSRWDALLHRVVKPFNKTFRQCKHAFARQVTSRGSCNVDGEAILWAAGRLAERREKNLWLVVISDGQPASMMSDHTALRAHTKYAVKKVIDAGIGVIAIGVGGGGSCVKDFYPDWVHVQSVEDLVTEGYGKISELFRKSLESAV